MKKILISLIIGLGFFSNTFASETFINPTYNDGINGEAPILNDFGTITQFCKENGGTLGDYTALGVQSSISDIMTYIYFENNWGPFYLGFPGIEYVIEVTCTDIPPPPTTMTGLFTTADNLVGGGVEGANGVLDGNTGTVIKFILGIAFIVLVAVSVKKIFF